MQQETRKPPRISSFSIADILDPSKFTGRSRDAQSDKLSDYNNKRSCGELRWLLLLFLFLLLFLRGSGTTSRILINVFTLRERPQEVTFGNTHFKKKTIYLFIYFLGKLVSHNSIIFLHNFYLVQCTCSSAQRVSGFLQPLMNRLLTSSSDRTVFPPNASFNDPKTGCCVSDC